MIKKKKTHNPPYYKGEQKQNKPFFFFLFGGGGGGGGEINPTLLRAALYQNTVTHRPINLLHKAVLFS